MLLQFASGVPEARLGGQCALAKVQASKTFEFCAREASQIFGGSSIVKEGKGKIVERLVRVLLARVCAWYGGGDGGKRVPRPPLPPPHGCSRPLPQSPSPLSFCAPAYVLHVCVCAHVLV